MYTLSVDCSNKYLLLWVSCWWSSCMHESHTVEHHGLSCDHLSILLLHVSQCQMSHLLLEEIHMVNWQMSKSGICWHITWPSCGAILYTQQDNAKCHAYQQKKCILPFTRDYCGLIFLPIIQMSVVLNRTVTVTWDTNTLLECTRCSKARNATQTHH